MRLKTKLYNSPLLKAKGLMFTKPLGNDEALILGFKRDAKVNIHTFFVFYPIDAIWANSNGKIVEIKRNIPPFTFLVTPRAEAKYIIETKGGVAKRIKIGDNVKIREKELEIRSK